MTTTAQQFIQTVSSPLAAAPLGHARPFVMLSAKSPDTTEVRAFGFVFPDESGVISLDTTNLKRRLGDWAGFAYRDMTGDELQRLRWQVAQPGSGR